MRLKERSSSIRKQHWRRICRPAKQSSWNNSTANDDGTWQTYREPCPRPLKYTSVEETKEEISPWKLKFQVFSTAFLAFFARNYYNFKTSALIISFLLNCILLSLRWESEEELEIDEHVIAEAEVFENNLDDQEFGDQSSTGAHLCTRFLRSPSLFPTTS